MLRRLSLCALCVVSMWARTASAQTTYHLHGEASSTASQLQLKTAGPDAAATAIQTANLRSTATGEKLVKAFDTQAGIPGVAGAIPSGATLTFQLWMKKTANVGTMVPRAKAFLDSATGTALCTATGTGAVTTTLSKFTISCTTTANVTLTTASRLYVWAGVNLTAGSTTTNFAAELDTEGTLNGNFDSQLVLPAILPAPSITSLTPSSGATGQSVVIAGTNFGATQGTSTLKFFNNQAATPTAWSATSITAPVPTGATTGNVTVTVAGQAASSSTFTVVPTPSITAVAPTSGAVGASVTLTGTNFGATQGTSTVKFNGTTGTPTAWSATSITVPVPTGATTGNIVVTVSGVASTGKAFTVLPTPTITTLTPTSGPTGTVVTISGTNFGTTQGTSTLKFNGVTATPSAWSATSITAPVPATATTGPVTVTVSGVVSNGVTYTVVGVPNISTLSPTSGAVGATVTVTGTSFGATQGTSTIKFNGTTAIPTSWSSTSIGVAVPPGATTGNVVVTVSGLNSNGKGFTVLPSPTITSLNPTSGFPGAAVTITGTNFGATKGTSTVKFNGVTAATTAWSATSIAATVPATATTGSVVVTVGGVASAGVLFTVPTLTSIDVTPHGLTVPVRGQQQFTAWGLYSDNVTRNVTANAAWASTDGTVAIIDAVTGLATVTATAGTATMTASIGTVSGSTGLTGAPSKFIPVGSLKTGRNYHTATRLLDGRVLITGGQSPNNQITNTAELYDPSTGRFTPTGNMLKKRHLHTATLLQNGTVLIAGGLSYFPDEYHSTAEIYDPVTGTFSYTGFMTVGRFFHTATLLADGRVLIDQGGHQTLPSPQPADIYDPATGQFTPAGTPAIARTSHTATLLPNGEVLETGGYYDEASAELFNPVTGTYTSAGTLTLGRSRHAATLLLDGRILVTGGTQVCPTACAAETFDAGTHTFSATTGMSVGRSAHSASVLDSGLVLLVGGQANSVDTATAELFDPATNTFVAAGAMATTRWGHTATRLQDGSVLLVGGSGPLAPNGAELYLPAGTAPLSLTVTPTAATLQAGNSRTFTATDHLGHPRADAVWSVDNASVATVDPATGLVTGVGVGAATLTATVGYVSSAAQVVVSAGPPVAGATLWSVAASPATVSRQVLQARGTGGPELFIVDSTAAETQIRGLTVDGQQLWSSSIVGPVNQVTPNGNGGVFVTLYQGCDNVNPMQLVSIDGPTGIWAWTYVGASTCTADLPQTALRADGAVAVATPGNTSGFPGLMVLDGVTGTPLAVPPIPQSTYTSFNGQQTLGYSRVGPPMVDADGNVHLLFEKRQLAYPPQVVDTAIWLMKVRPDLTSTTTLLSSSTNDTNLFPGRIIPDGTGGLLATWIDNPIVANGLPPLQSTLRAARILSSGAISLFDVPLTLPLDLLTSPPSTLPTNAELTLGESGRAFVTYGSTVVSFSVVDGSPIWSYSSSTQPIHALVADSSNGLVARVSTQTSDVLRFNQSGGVTSETWAASTVNYFASGLWLGTTGSGDAAAFFAPPLVHATTGWFTATMGQSRQQQPNLYVSDPQNAKPVEPATNPQGVIRYAMGKVKLALEQELLTSFPTCNPWLNLNGVGVTGLSQLSLMLQLNTMGHGLFWNNPQFRGGKLNDIVAFQGGLTGNPPVEIGVPVGWAVTFNREGFFFQPTVIFQNRLMTVGMGPQSYPGGSIRAQALTILHELAHVVRVVPKDFGVPGGSAENDRAVDFNCRALIQGITP